MRLHAIPYILLLAFVVADGKPGRRRSDDTLHGYYAVSSSAKNSSSTATASSSAQPSLGPTPSAPVLRFFTPSNATTCTTLTFRWQIIPSSSNVTNINVRLFITNEGVQQTTSTAPATSSPSRTRRHLPHSIVARNIANYTSLAAGEFDWSAVTVPQGWYILEAFPANNSLSNWTSQSEPFFVTTGSNTTCIIYSGIPKPSPRPTASLSNVKLSAGALAGTVVGTVVGLIALLGAFILPRLWRRGVPEHRDWTRKSGRLYHVF